MLNGGGRCDPVRVAKNDLIARTDAERGKPHVYGAGATGGSDGMLDAMVFAE